MTHKTIWMPVLAAAVLLAAGSAFGEGGGHSRPVGNPSGPVLRTGWVIGTDQNGTAVLFHTRDGGATWVEQGDNT